MTNQELMLEIAEYKAKINLSFEKSFLKSLQPFHKEAEKKTNKLLRDTFAQLQNEEGIIPNEEIFKFNRDKKIRESLLKIQTELAKNEALLIKHKLTDTIKFNAEYETFLIDMTAKGTRGKKIDTKTTNLLLNKKWTSKDYKEISKRNLIDRTDALFTNLLIASNNNLKMKDFLKLQKEAQKKFVNKTMLLYQTEQTRKAAESSEFILNKYNKDKKHKVQWIATLDDRTCETCGKMDGNVFEADKIQQPPLHPRCRCVLLRYWEENENQLRRARDKNGKNYLTETKNFEEWKKGKFTIKDLPNEIDMVEAFEEIEEARNKALR